MRRPDTARIERLERMVSPRKRRAVKRRACNDTPALRRAYSAPETPLTTASQARESY
jgi:hypothetical protein